MRKQNKGGFVVLAVLAGIAVFSAGLMLITNSHSKLVAGMNPDTNKAYFGATVPVGPGVMPAVANNKTEAALSLLAGAATAYVIDKSSGSKDKSPSTPTIAINGNGNNVNTGTSGMAKQDNSSAAP